MVNYGYEIIKDSQYNLEMVRPTKQEEEFSAMLIAGNSYSSNSRVASYTFLKINNQIKIIVSASYRARLPGGKINTVSIIHNGAIYNTFQQQLFDLQRQLEVAEE